MRTARGSARGPAPLSASAFLLTFALSFLCVLVAGTAITGLAAGAPAPSPGGSVRSSTVVPPPPSVAPVPPGPAGAPHSWPDREPRLEKQIERGSSVHHRPCRSRIDSATAMPRVEHGAGR